MAGVGFQFRPALPHWSKALPNALNKSLLEFSGAETAWWKIIFHGGDLVGSGKQPVERNNHGVGWLLRCLHRRRVRDDAHDFLSQRLFRKKQLDCIAVTFAHLLAGQPQDRSDFLADARLG